MLGHYTEAISVASIDHFKSGTFRNAAGVHRAPFESRMPENPIHQSPVRAVARTGFAELSAPSLHRAERPAAILTIASRIRQSAPMAISTSSAAFAAKHCSVVPPLSPRAVMRTSLSPATIRPATCSGLRAPDPAGPIVRSALPWTRPVLCTSPARLLVRQISGRFELASASLEEDLFVAKTRP